MALAQAGNYNLIFALISVIVNFIFSTMPMIYFYIAMLMPLYELIMPLLTPLALIFGLAVARSRREMNFGNGCSITTSLPGFTCLWTGDLRRPHARWAPAQMQKACKRGCAPVDSAPKTWYA